MHGVLPSTERGAISCSDKSVGDESSSDISVGEECEWFVRAARDLLAPKPGLVLHLETDCGERNGERYAGGRVKVPAHIIRQLLRGPHGAQWLAAIMDGCCAEWWIAHQRALRIAAAVDQEI
jgi:hypothetical protein